MLDKLIIKNKKGFTLIELLIVVAIIGILAAIAIPQFAAYRQRAFNSSALSDLRNVTTGQESLFADTQGYGSVDATADGAVLGTANAAEDASSQTGPMSAATGNIKGAFLFNILGTHAFSISNGVTVGGTLTVANNLGTSYVMMATHNQGTNLYGRDSDSSAVYRADNDLGEVDGVAVGFDAAIPDSTLDELDLVATDGWAVM